MNKEITIQDVLEKTSTENSINLIHLRQSEEDFNSPFFSEKKNISKGFFNNHSSSESTISISKFDVSEKLAKTFTALASETIFISGWKNVENISSRLIEIYENTVVLECLIDRELNIFEEREFRSSLFSEEDLALGNLFLLRVFDRQNESRLEIHTDPKLTLQKDFPNIDFPALFKKSKLFKN